MFILNYIDQLMLFDDTRLFPVQCYCYFTLPRSFRSTLVGRVDHEALVEKYVDKVYRE